MGFQTAVLVVVMSRSNLGDTNILEKDVSLILMMDFDPEYGGHNFCQKHWFPPIIHLVITRKASV
jgi:hypothetical protein